MTDTVTTPDVLPARYCRWLSRDDEGRPRCEHGWALSNGHGSWTCPEKARIRYNKSNTSDKYRARKKLWNGSDAGRESKKRYEQTERMRELQSWRRFTSVRLDGF